MNFLIVTVFSILFSPLMANECTWTATSANLCIELELPPAIPVDQEVKFDLTFRNTKNGQLVDPQGAWKIFLHMDMGKHSHGSAPLKVVKKKDGLYGVSNAWFSMGGLWEIRMRLGGKTGELLKKEVCAGKKCPKPSSSSPSK